MSGSESTDQSENEECEKINPDASAFCEGSELADMILLVQDKKLHVNKTMLMLASPVFRKMFSSDFKEKMSDEISLPGKEFHHVVAFLRCIHPEILDLIYGENVFEVLPLVDEYQCVILKDRCEHFLIHDIPKEKCTGEKDTEYVSKCLLFAEKFNLKKVRKSCVDCLSNTHSFYLKGPQFDSISVKRKLRIFRKRIASFEKKALIVPTKYEEQSAFFRMEFTDTDDEN